MLPPRGAHEAHRHGADGPVQTPRKLSWSKGTNVNDDLSDLGVKSGINFPDRSELQSPNKRSKSPAHEIKKTFSQLWFTEPELLASVIEDFFDWMSVSHGLEDRLNHLLDQLTAASRNVRRPRAAWLHEPSSPLASDFEDAIDEPPPPSPSVKKAVKELGHVSQRFASVRSGATSMETSFMSDATKTTLDIGPGTPATEVDEIPNVDGVKDDCASQATHYDGPLSSMEGMELDRLLEPTRREVATARAKRARSAQRSPARRPEPPNPLLQTPQIPKSDARQTTATKASPTKCYRVDRMYSDGLSQITLPDSITSLNFHLRVECHRLLQTGNLSAQELDTWQMPRTSESLRSFVRERGIPFQHGVESDFSDHSLVATLRPSPSVKGPLLVTEVHPPRRQALIRYQHKFGGDRILHLTSPPFTRPPSGIRDPDFQTKFLDMLRRDHSLFGRTWVLFLAQDKKRKDGTFQLLFFATSGPDIKTVTMPEFLDWAIPFYENADASSCKIYARLDLHASRGMLVATLAEHEVDLGVDDVYSGEMLSAVSDQSGHRTVMSDGNSLASIYLHIMARVAQSLDYIPAVLQFRVAGCKGTTTLSRDAYDRFLDQEPPTIKLKLAHSQIKIKLKPVYDPVHFAVIVVQVSGPPKPSVIYPLSLPILIDRGVSRDAITKLATRDIQQEMANFLTAARSGPTLLQYMQLQSQDLDTPPESSVHSSALPSNGKGKVRCLLEAGFEPMQCRFLADELLSLKKREFKTIGKSWKINSPRSTYLLGVPDLEGVLKPNEVHVRFSVPLRDPITGQDFDSWDGLPALFQRNPARRSSDIQKAYCVCKPELHDQYDVFVFSTQGEQPLAAKLSGGDYDGDYFWGCIEPSLTEAFENAAAPLTSPVPKDFGILVDRTKLRDIVKIPSQSEEKPDDEVGVREFIRRNVMARMKGSLLGLITLEHERYTYHTGSISSSIADQLVDLHDLLVDADKNGYRFGWQDWDRLKRRLQIPKMSDPAYWKYTRSKGEDQTKPNPKPKDNSILDELYFGVVEPAVKGALKQLEDLIRPNANNKDADLTCFYEDMLASAEDDTVAAELSALQASLQTVRTTWRQESREYFDRKENHRPADWSVVETRCREAYLAVEPKNPSHPAIQQWLKRQGFSYTTWERLKASALVKFHHDANPKMLFHAAGDHLMYLKATATKHHVVTEQIHSVLKPTKFKFHPDVDDVREDAWADAESENEYGEIDEGIFDQIELYSGQRPPSTVNPEHL